LTTAPPPTSSYKLRAARRGDAEPVKALLGDLSLQTDANTFTWVIQHPEMKVIVATDVLDKAVGVVALSHRPQIQLAGRVVTIDLLVVSSGARKKGVGRQLLEAAVKEAKVFSAKQVEVRIPSADEGTKAFLTRCGFAAVERAVFRLEP
jgi:N-acetylglutamate synthase-like GNAT family acetyltransferase